jgi:protein TonB
MKTVVASFDDLVFRARNKDYGSYELRKRIGKNTIGGFILGSILVALFFTIPVLSKYLMGEEEASKETVNMQDVKLMEPPPMDDKEEQKKEKKPQKKVKEPPPPKRDQVKYTEPKVEKIEEVDDPNTEITNTDTLSRDIEVGAEETEGSGEGPPRFTAQTGEGDPNSDVNTNFKPQQEEEKKAVDQFALSNEPQPVNLDRIKNQIEYPQIAREGGIHGTVVLEVTINERGKYESHRVVRSPHKLLTKECEKHIASLRFQPGKQGGKPVRFKVQVPFRFKLDR